MFNTDREKLIIGFMTNENKKIKKEIRGKLKYILEDLYQLEAQERLYKERLSETKEDLAKREKEFEVALTEYWGVRE